MQNTTLFLFRHAQANNSDILYGEDEPLSCYGLTQAEKIGCSLKSNGITPSYLYVSPLVRTVQTAEGIKKSFPDAFIHFDPRLRDTEGTYVGKPRNWLDNMTDVHQHIDPENPFHTARPASIIKRMIEVLNEIGKNHPGETVVVVSHQEPIALVRYVLQFRRPPPLWRELEKCGVLEPAEGLKWIVTNSGSGIDLLHEEPAFETPFVRRERGW